MATSREVDSIGTIVAGAAVEQYTFVVLDPVTEGWIPAQAADSVAWNLIGVAQHPAVAGEALNVMIKGQTKLIFDTTILSGAASNAGDLGAVVGVHATTARGIKGVAPTAAGVRGNIFGYITDKVSTAGNIGSIFLVS